MGQQLTFTNKFKQSIPHDLETALESCLAAARDGYDIAKENLNESAIAIESVSKSLSECLQSLNDGSVRTPGIIKQLQQQLISVVDELESLQRTTERTLEERRQRFDRFSISLFGRTMAGKSTLMEILTHGDGQSIGNGAQRKTRDIRSYCWNGLEITDVPGVAAFEGEQDEELAFKAAAQADLVLFLITDDAPQPVEAECLAKVRKLGKPVLGICNVKVTIDDEDDLSLFLRRPDKMFDRNRIEQLLNQFHEFADRHIPGKRVPFIVTHLRSRYLADCPEYATKRDLLLQASRFKVVESRIIREVINRGAFLRVKSFIDGAEAPMLELSDHLLNFSAQNSSSGRVLVDKKRQLRTWSQNFKASGEERINTLVSKLMNDLRSEVPSFSEDHYDDKSASKEWNKILESNDINGKIKNLQEQLAEECKAAFREIARELKSELSLVTSLADDRNIDMEKIYNLKRAWNWVTTIAAAGFGIAALAVPVLGWVAAGIGVFGWLFSFFFDDREEKASRAREKLSRKLHQHIDKMERELGQQLITWLNQELLRKQVYGLLDDFRAVIKGIFTLADAQRMLAWALNDRQKFLCTSLIANALQKLNAEASLQTIRDVARVPGLAIMLLIEPNTCIPAHIKEESERLLSEVIWFAVDTGNQISILSQAIGRGCDRKEISIEWDLKIAHLPVEKLDSLTRSRIKLAQQLTGLHVMH